MLEVRAIARPRIPPGKISLSTNQGTGRKGKVDGEQQSGGKSTEADSQLTDLCPTDLCEICACRAVSVHMRKEEGCAFFSLQSSEKLRELDKGPWKEGGNIKGWGRWHCAGNCQREVQWLGPPAHHRRQLGASAKHTARCWLYPVPSGSHPVISSAPKLGEVHHHH